MARRGFTLIELLVVISVVNLLSSVVLSSLNSARKTANATKTFADFKEIEKALLLYTINSGFSNIPNESVVGSTFTGVEFRKFLPTLPTQTMGQASAYGYDNDNDSTPSVTDNCSATSADTRGVNILITQITTEEANLLDETIDNGDGWYCGKFLIYNEASPDNLRGFYKVANVDNSF